MQNHHYYLAQHREISTFNFAAQNRLPVLLKGPTGCGKTRFVEHMAEQLARPVYTIACHDDLTASDLVGRYLIGDKGTYWQDGPLTRAVREGGICYLDEVVEARKDTTVVLHPLSDHRRILPISQTGESLIAHDDFMLVISYNPGYQNLLKGLKPSTRQRFVAISFDYPLQDKEIEIVRQESGSHHELAKQLVSLATDLRRLNEHGIEEAASTRLLVYAAKMIHSGMPAKDACMTCLAEPITDDTETLIAIEHIIDSYFHDNATNSPGQHQAC